MRPKFEVGEVVILQGKVFPQFNGERTVSMLLTKGNLFTCRKTGKVLEECASEVMYLFEEPLLDDRGFEITFVEPSLRKKHLPGELSFTDLMASLSSPKLITHQA